MIPCRHGRLDEERWAQECVDRTLGIERLDGRGTRAAYKTSLPRIISQVQIVVESGRVFGNTRETRRRPGMWARFQVRLASETVNVI